MGLLETLFSLATLLLSVGVTARRRHDIGRTGWWPLAWLVIPLIVWLASGIMFLVAIAVPYGTTDASGGWHLDGDDIEWESVGEAFAFLPAAIVLMAAVVITLAVIVWAIVWMARQGESGQNRFGPDPRALDAPELSDAT